MKVNARMKNIFINFLLYSVMVLYFVILFEVLFHKRRAGTFQSVNLIPFRTIAGFLFTDDRIAKSLALSNLLGNIVIFVPLGIYIMLMNRNKSQIINTSIVVFLSVLVEITQFIFKVGAMDIDDVILNTIGGLAGIMLFCVIHLIFKGKTKTAIAWIAPIGGIVAFMILILINR